MDAELGDNQGSTIADGFRPSATVAYSAVIADGPGTEPYPNNSGEGGFAYNLATAKDIVVYKTVSASHAGYGDELTYTITVRTNEYYAVDNVVVTDRIGDGQTFKDFGTSTWPAGQLPPPESLVKEADGTTEFVWELGTLPPMREVKLTYFTEVDTHWSGHYGQGPIYAGDSIPNDVTVTGETAVSGAVLDSDHTSVAIRTPVISETIVFVNNEPADNGAEAYVAVGDVVIFEVEYDASQVHAKQNKVEIRSYLPLGTEPVNAADPDLALFGVLPAYDPALNALIWTFEAALPEGAHEAAKVHALVVDNKQYVEKEKGAQNLVVLSFQNSPGTVGSGRDSVRIRFAEPELTVSRKVVRGEDYAGAATAWKDHIQVNGTEEVYVKLEIANSNTADTSPAYEIALEETVPPELDALSLELITADGVLADNGRFLLEDPILPGETFTIIYKVQVKEGVGAGRQIHQESALTYYSQPEIPGNPDQIRREYKENVGPDHTMTVDSATIRHERVHFGAGNGTDAPEELVPGQDWSRVRVGDWVVYQVEVNVPEHDAAYDTTLDIRLPVYHQLLEVYDSYDPVNLTGIALAANTDYMVSGTVNGGLKVSIPKPVVLPPSHTFYVKTKVTGIGGGPDVYAQSQNSSGEFSWMDAASNGTEHTIGDTADPLTVAIPKLAVEWFFDEDGGGNYKPFVSHTPSPLKQGDVIDLRFRIVNQGENTAYDFVPILTAPLGFRITEHGNGGVLSSPENDLDRVVTYPPVAELAKGDSLNYDIAVEMVSVPGAGAFFDVEGTTGYYYSSAETFAAGSTAPFERHAPAEATANLGVPAVLVTNVIQSTTNTEDPDSTTPGMSRWVRPGDVVEYEVEVTVPAGTQALDLVLESRLADHGKFEILDWEIDLNQEDPLSGVPIDSTDGVVRVELGDSPDPAAADPAVVIYTLKFRVLAKENGNKPTNGSFQKGNTETVAESLKSSVTWKTSEAAVTANETESDAAQLTVKQPNVSFTAAPIAAFTDLSGTSTASFAISNSGASRAYIPEFAVEVPAGFSVDELSVTSINALGGTEDISGNPDDGYEIRWKDFFVEPGATLNLSLNLEITAAIGAAQEDLALEAKLEHYHSTDGALAADGQSRKVYDVDVPVRTPALTVAGVQLTAQPVGSTYDDGSPGAAEKVRPGDVVVYELNIGLPGVSPAYDVVLKNTGLTGLTIVGVKFDGAMIPPSSDGYVLGDLTEDAVVHVIAKVSADADDFGDPAQARFAPAITYVSADGDMSPHSAAATAVTHDVMEPAVDAAVDADPKELDEAGEQSEVIVTVGNASASDAFDAKVIVTIIHHGLFEISDLQTVGTPDVDLSDPARTVYTWEGRVIEAGSEEEWLTFRAEAHADTSVNEKLTVTAQVISYDSLPGEAEFGTAIVNVLDEVFGQGAVQPEDLEADPAEMAARMTYGPHDPVTEDVALAGRHELTEATPDEAELTAGKEAGFTHTLTNTGAGRDTFRVEFASDGPFPAVLKLDGVKIATGQMDGGDWIWEIEDGHVGKFAGGVLTLTLDAGASAELALTVQVPEHVPYGTTAEIVIEAGSELAGGTETVTDTIIVVGTVLDGWSGTIGYDELSENPGAWTKPGHPHGGTLTLQAVSAVHVARVTATYSQGAYQSDEIELTLVNAVTYAGDGYKLWSVTHVLPNSLTAGDYELTFRALDAGDEELEADGTAGANGANNPCAVQESAVTIAISADKTTLTEPEETVVFTVTVTNDPAATSGAHDAGIEITLPDGFELVSVDNADDLDPEVHAVHGEAGDGEIECPACCCISFTNGAAKAGWRPSSAR